MKFSQWLSLIILTISLYVFWQIRNVVLLALTAVIFAVVMNRAVRFLERWIKSRPLSVLILLGLGIGAFTLIGFVIVPPFAGQVQELVNLTPEIVDRIQAWLFNLEVRVPPFLIRYFQDVENVLGQLRSLNFEMVFGRFYMLFSNTLTITLNMLLVIVTTIMILLNPKPYHNLLVKTFPSSLRQRANRVLDDCERAITGWFVGIIFNMFVIAVMSMIGLWVLGVPLAFANGLVAGLLAFIPNLGPAISIVPPIAIALLDAPWKALAVLILYIVIQQIESNILTPTVMRKQVSLLPAVTLLSQIVFAVFFGFLGLLLALPLTIISQQWLKEFWVKGYLEQH